MDKYFSILNNDEINISNYDFNYSKDEINILKKIAAWTRCVEVSFDKLEPHRIPVYLYELSSEFHSYWNMGKDDENKRFIDKNGSIKDEKIVFLKIVANVIKNGMNILGVETPEKM